MNTSESNLMRKEKIWLSSPHLSGKEEAYIKRAFAKNHVFPLGENVSELEQRISKFASVQHCTCLSSGTAAIHLALILLGVSQDDEVICSSFTFAASVNPISYLKAKPILVDSEKSTWNMDPELLEEAIIDRIEKTGKKPKAIILVHLYGMPSKMTAIMEVSNKYEIPVIEDSAEALGSSYANKACGSFGEIGIFSFNGNKIITTSGGGALVSNQEKHTKKALFLATQARDPKPYYHHTEVGYNYRMSNISAGIGCGQMEVLDERIAKRRENFFFYRDSFAEFDFMNFQVEPNEKYFSNHWLSAFSFSESLDLDIDKFVQYCSELQIETRHLWKPMHLQPIFKDVPAYLNGVSDNLFNKGVCLPSSSNISDEDRTYVVDQIKKYLNSNG